MSDLQMELVTLRRTLHDALQTDEQGLPKTARLLASLAREQVENIAESLPGYVVVGPPILAFGFEVNLGCLRNNLTTACSDPSPAALRAALGNAIENADRTLSALGSIAMHEFPAAS